MLAVSEAKPNGCVRANDRIEGGKTSRERRGELGWETGFL